MSILLGTPYAVPKQSFKNFANINHLILATALLGSMVMSFSAHAIGPCDAAKPAALNATTAVRTQIAGREDFFKITAPSDGLLTFTPVSDISTYARLYDKDCIGITNISYYASSNTISKGIYYIGVNSRKSGPYKILIEGDFATDDRGASCASAAVARSAVETGVIGPYGDRDFFQVNLKGAGQLIAKQQSNASVFVQVFDKSCISVSTPSYSGINKAFGAGTYYVGVIESANRGKGNYNLSLSGDIVKPVGTCGGKSATLSGTNGDDVIRGTAGNDVIQSFGGNDVILGLAGDDTICGGDGDDIVQGGDGIDRLSGDAGNDILQGGDKNDALTGGLGIDVCDGGNQIDVALTCEVKSLVP